MVGTGEGRDALKVRFIADAMLGALARWMRVLGCDVEYSNAIEDAEVVERAVDEDRVILTRDFGLVKRRGARGRYLLIESDHVAEQLRQVAAAFLLPTRPELLRCIRCNTMLESARKESVRGHVPAYVYNTQSEFAVCPSCGRIYWPGTHRERMEEDVARMLGDS